MSNPFGTKVSSMELAFVKAFESKALMTSFQIAMFVCIADSIVNCAYDSIWSIIAQCVSVFFFVGTCLLIIDSKEDAKSSMAISKSIIIYSLCTILAHVF